MLMQKRDGLLFIVACNTIEQNESMDKEPVVKTGGLILIHITTVILTEMKFDLSVT